MMTILVREDALTIILKDGSTYAKGRIKSIRHVIEEDLEYVDLTLDNSITIRKTIRVKTYS